MSLDTSTSTKARRPVAREPERKVAETRSSGRPIVKTMADGSLVATLADGTTISYGGTIRDRFSIDQSMIPDGFTYEWRNHTVIGQTFQEDTNDDYRNGWRPVPASRHPDLAGRDTNGAIIMSGSILCERPLAFSEKARADERDRYRASEQRQRQQFGLHAPAFDTSDPRLRPVINKTVERAPDKLMAID